MEKPFPDPKEIINMDIKDILRTVMQSGLFQHVSLCQIEIRLRFKSMHNGSYDLSA